MRALVLFVCAPLMAAPVLRLSTSSLVWYPESPRTQTICTQNAGDGTLSLSATSTASWLTVSIDTKQCLQFTFDPTGMPPGTYTADVTISDPNAVDAPQFVTATLFAGGGDPVSVDRYVAAGSFLGIPYYTGDTSFTSGPAITTQTQDGGKWLAVSFYPYGTLGYFYQTGYIYLTPPASMPDGVYKGTVTQSNYIARTIPVTMRVTHQPVAFPSQPNVSVRAAQGGPGAAYPFLLPIAFRNEGLGTLQLDSVSASGEGVSADLIDGAVYLKVAPGARSPGIYHDAKITVQCNAANCPLDIPVEIEVVARAAPVIDYQGVQDNAAWLTKVAPGDVCILKGDQLSFAAPAIAATLPLPPQLGGARVIVNNVYAPLYYSSYGQLAFQIPYGTATGTALVQVERDGVLSNTVTVTVQATAPQVAAITDASYNLRDAAHPTTPGETLLIWAIGLGLTNPQIDAGAAAPADPLATVVQSPILTFTGRPVTPSWAGLSPGSAGLYQVIVKVPDDTPKGTAYISLGGNWLTVKVQ